MIREHVRNEPFKTNMRKAGIMFPIEVSEVDKFVDNLNAEQTKVMKEVLAGYLVTVSA